MSSWRMIGNAALCDKRLCMIDADLAAISHVSGSHQLGRVLHEVITFTVLGHRVCSSRLRYAVRLS